jgi:hypothetical protein
MAMRVTTGTIRKGKVELEEKDLPEGTTVTVLVPDAGDTFEVTPEEKAKLLAAIREVERGEVEDGWELLRSIRPK